MKTMYRYTQQDSIQEYAWIENKKINIFQKEYYLTVKIKLSGITYIWVIWTMWEQSYARDFKSRLNKQIFLNDNQARERSSMDQSDNSYFVLRKNYLISRKKF